MIAPPLPGTELAHQAAVVRPGVSALRGQAARPWRPGLSALRPSAGYCARWQESERGYATANMEAMVMKRVVWVLGVAAVCGALLAGRDDIRRFREMRRL